MNDPNIMTVIKWAALYVQTKVGVANTLFASTKMQIKCK